MASPKTMSCFIVGEGSLVVQCATALLDRGHEIRGIATDEPTVRAWAAGRDITTVDADHDLAAWLADAEYDYLFSIVNLRMLPEAVIRTPRVMAVNFHDGPLPRYAGINATSWALLDGATEYGVTWHEMVTGADRGRILAQKLFPIAPGETAFSLNARCFDAGMESFAELADAITADKVAPREQDFEQRSYFGKFQRPGGASTIDFDTDAEKVAAFVAAHDYGAGYPNPFGLAKVVVGDDALVVDGVEVLDETSDAAPGTVLAIESGVRVATRGNDIRLAPLRCPLGAPVDDDALAGRGLEVGAVLAAPSETAGRLLEETVRAEPRWARTLGTLNPASWPTGGDAAASEHRFDLPVGFTPRRAAAAFVAALDGWSSEGPTHVALRTPAIDERVGEHGALFARRLPLAVSVDPDAEVADALDAIEESFAALEARGPHLRDLFLRDPALASVRRDGLGVVLPVCVALGDVDESAPADGVLVTVGEQVTWSAGPETDPARVAALAGQFATFLEGLASGGPIGDVPIASDEARERVLTEFVGPTAPLPEGATVHGLFEQQAAATPDADAVTHRGVTLSYAELDRRSNQVARVLRARGVRADSLVGLCMERSVDMVVAALGIMKAGGAYVPLDPSYPQERLAFMVEDSHVAVLLTQERVRSRLPESDASVLSLDGDAAVIERQDDGPLEARAQDDNLAYVIYTSGSTGRPKGVMVEHRNVVSFFAGMDDRVGGAPGVMLAVTSMNFDISVLELFWTLARGFHVVLHEDDHDAASFAPKHADRPIGFGLFYFSSDESEGLVDKYQLLLDGARFADRNGFGSVWTPERHFHAFGGLFPNPSVTSAALATITENVDLRAGSCVTPLHSPIRIAEEWSVVDNLSKGRVGLSVASGWQPNDFAIRPEAWADRHNRLFEDIETLRALWRGESRTFPNGEGNDTEIRILPRPYSDELPIWVTAAGNPATFERAGRVGANLLTHLLGQSVDELREKIAIYRKAWAEAGHEGRGTVSLMLHTYVGTSDDQSREVVREPMKSYLRSAVGLVKAAAWSFPTFKKTTTMEDGSFGIDHLSDDDMDALLNFAFERYYETAGLFGDVDKCVRIVDDIKGADVDEIPCLIDFGVPTPIALEALPRLAEVLRRANEFVGVDGSERDFSFAAEVARHDVTHFQCTPSQMRLLLADSKSEAALGSIPNVLVGGEPLPAPLARELEQLVDGAVTNMYGPTETTIWSTTAPVRDITDTVPIGTPIPNTRVVMLDRRGRLVPPGSAGELCIGGPGVVRGYLGRPELTAERFVPDPFGDEGARLYRTGDLAAFEDDGTISFHGRLDHQVKLRGHRIELGEIEARLAEHASVRAAATIVREDTPGDARLVAYVIPAPGADVSAETLRPYLAERLPEHMVPSAFVRMDRFPETPNRKVDRKALPAPEKQAAGTAAAFVAPESQLEEKIAEIWCELLGLPRVGTQDNFFDLGGHSLLTIQVHGVLKGMVDKPLSLVDLFRYPTVASLARFLDEGDDTAEQLEKTRERAAGRKAAMARRRAARGRRR